MIPPNDCGYSQDSCSNPPHASDCSDQYFEPHQSVWLTFDSAGSQMKELPLVAPPDPMWFTEFVLYESGESDSDPDSKSDFQASELVRMDRSSSVATTPLFASSSGTVPYLIDPGVPFDALFSQWIYQTNLDDADIAVDSGSTFFNFQWSPTEPASNSSAASSSGNVSGEDWKQSSPEHSVSNQKAAASKLSVPRIRYFNCPTCHRQHLSESRLSEHLRKYHPPARFICRKCGRGFKQEKDLKRHQSTHETSIRPFACACTKTYPRHDGLLRHFTEMAARPREAGRHRAVESNSIPRIDSISG